MSAKTLGRIAFDAFQASKGMSQENIDILWPPNIPMEHWEAAANAVRNVVIQECAAQCFSTMCSHGEQMGALRAKQRVLTLLSATTEQPS